MTVKRMDNVGIVVEDLDAAIAFFTELGLELEGRAPVEGEWADGVTGLRGMRVEIAMMRTPDGHSRLEISRFLAPPVAADHRVAPVNSLGYLRVMFAVEDINGLLARLRKHGAKVVGEVVQYQDLYRLCYIRGPEGILIGLAEQLGQQASRTDPMKKGNAGFTLIEVLVVIGIVAILALLAIPNYSSRIVQEQVLEALPLADVVKPPVAIAWATGQPLPADNAAAGLPPPEKIVGNLVGGVRLEAGAIHMTFGNRANNQILGKVLTIRPAVVEGTPLVPIAWVCGFAPVPGKMTAKGMNRTDIPPNLLPLKCRAA